MALRSLVEGECGAANPLVQWSAHFSQDKAVGRGGLQHDRLAEITHHGDARALEEQMVNEFLGNQRPAVPQTFNMDTLLNELQGVGLPPSLQQHHPTIHQDASVREWVEEFASGPPPPQASQVVPSGPESGWVQEFAQEQDLKARQWAEEFAPTEDEKWADEFEQQLKSGKDLASVAKEMAESITDPDIQATEFFDFVKKLGSGQLQVENDTVVAPGESKDWAEEFAKQTEDEPSEEFWERLEKEWEEMARQENHPWLSDYSQFKEQEYTFQTDNPLRDTANPLEEGLKKLSEGDLPSAALLFEAEVQARPDSIKGWQYLGTTQADNEQELAAIAALHKCLELDPGNLPAIMALAVSYTNESQQSKALDALRNWLQHNPKYSSLVPEGVQKSAKPFLSSFMNKEEHAEVCDLFLRAAQLSPDQVDADIQIGLGVLFNLSGEYNKAVDCFSAALEVRPEDAMLWNKLGATLANGSRSEEAVHAYRRALQYLPGFTRSRYNLGISCINLKLHKEAVEHFLTALNLQRQAKGPQGITGTSQMSESIWSTLRLAITFMGRPDLVEKLEQRDLDFLLREFGV